MTKILIGMLSLALVGTGGLVAAVEGFGGSDPLPTVSLPAATTTDEPETETEGETEDNSGSGSDDSGRGRGRGRGGDDGSDD